jgi:peptide/nickel transport system substrate-binding protein
VVIGRSSRTLSRLRGRLGLAALTAFAALVLLVPAATGAPARHAGVGSTNTLTVRLLFDWTTIDPLVDNRPVPDQIEAALYDSLTAPSKNPANSTPVPYVATSWTSTPKSVTFHIRKGVTCQDGHVLTPGDIEASFAKFLTLPKTNGQINQIFGPGPYKLTASNKNGTFTFTTETPYRLLLVNVGNTPIVCPAGLAAIAADPRALQTAAYGSGPYELVSAVHGDSVVLKKNPGWTWTPQGGTPGSALPDNLILKVVADDTTAANLLLTGGLDIAQVSGTDVTRLVSDKSILYQRVRGTRTFGVDFNLRPGGVFTDLALRQAIQAAVDPKAFLQAGYAGRGDVSVTPLSAVLMFVPASECYSAKVAALVKPANLARAKQILTKAGYTYSGGKLMKDGQPVSVRALTSLDVGSAPDLLQAVLTQLGFTVQLNSLGGSAYGTAFLNANFDIALVRGGESVYAGNLGKFYGPPPPAGPNYIGYNDIPLQHLANRASQTPGPAACEWYQKAATLEIQKAYSVPIAAPWTEIFARKATVGNFAALGLVIPFYYIRPAK